MRTLLTALSKRMAIALIFFQVMVVYGQEEKVMLNFSNTTDPEVSPWNYTMGQTSHYTVYDNLVNDQGNPSSITVELDFVAGIRDSGVPDGMGWVYPAHVTKTKYYRNGPMTLTIRNLDVSKQYHFNFYAYQEYNDADRTTVYSIGSKKDSINASNNYSETADVYNITPDSNGEVVVNISSGQNSSWTYITSIVIAEQNPNTIIAPGNLLATITGANAIQLEWQDNAGNESGYIIEEDKGATGNFSTRDTVNTNISTYSINNLALDEIYQYRVRAYNGSGVSEYSDIVKIYTESNPGYTIVKWSFDGNFEDSSS
ncbi:MAG TPA: hypothetical protein DDY13_15640 [Cytophagales bacterium]|jgi:hypothetical protein|nr:hypothetical protein [Cytophagales bacterium]